MTKATITFRGKTATKRKQALDRVAPLTYSLADDREAWFINARIVLSTRPSASVIEALKLEWKIGEVAQRLSGNELPKSCKSAGERIEYAGIVVCDMSLPAAKKVGKGKVGRRSEAQHKIVRAVDQAWSHIASELAIGKGQSIKDKNKKQRERSPEPGGRFKVPAPVAQSDLPTPKQMDVATVCTFLMSNTATADAFVKKYAALIPNEFIECVELVGKLRTATLAAANAFEERKARDNASD